MKKEKEIPAEVLYIKLGGITSFSWYEEILAKYPEHFPKETKRKQMWESIPKEILNEFLNRVTKKREELITQTPHPMKGIMWYLNHPEEHEEQNNALKITEVEANEYEKTVHNELLIHYLGSWDSWSK